jgi:predicted O-methyltransferase YrrM
MTLKQALKRVPGLGPAAAALYRHIAEAREDRILRRLAGLAHSSAPALVAAVEATRSHRPAGVAGTLRAIEEQRAQWAACEDRLDDGTLIAAAVSDGDDTVARACRASKKPKEAFLLHALVREIRPARVIELGTNLGISSAYQRAALDAVGGEARLLTCEASPYRLRLASGLHERLGLGPIAYCQGLFDDTLEHALASMGSIDYAFIDARHQYQPTLDYFDAIWERAEPGAVFVFDDVRLTDGMERAWRRLRADPRLALVVDLHSIGIGVGRREPGEPRHVLPPLRRTFFASPETSATSSGSRVSARQTARPAAGTHQELHVDAHRARLRAARLA